MKPIRVFIVEDSPVVQRLLEYVIGGDPRLQVVGKAVTAEEALRQIPLLRPDVVSMDVRLPGMDGFEATRRIMRDHPVPIVIVAADVTGPGLDISMNALRAGALAVVEKPGSTDRADYEALSKHLCTQLAIMSKVTVIRQRFRKPGDGGRRLPGLAPPPGRFAMLGVVASTGGPNALVRLFNALPKEFPLPIVVVQHIGASFAQGFADWLGTAVPQPVALAEDRQLPIPGHIHVAPGNLHLALRRGRLVLDGAAPVCSQRPSGDVLLQSMADDLGPQALGVLLTGMGEDGARGLLAIREAGGHTLAEDESSAIIYGMPAVAARLGAVVEQLPLDAIGRRLAGITRASAATGARG